ncbi:transposase [Microvirga lotononidis]|uniref:Mutator family transposase n=1 Tax=Microvirga lotononidis TaxID=864069 RepID=I4Z4X0_9HYPH|nr:transposase [Microvirga lotononidis]
MRRADRIAGEPHVDELFDQAVGHRIPVAVDLDMIVRGHPAALPAGEGIRLVGQRAAEITADYTAMIYAATVEEIAERRRAFLRKWRLRHPAVANSLEEAGEALFAFTQLPPSQWKSARTTNAIERLHEEFKRRIKTQTVLPSDATAAMLFWALLASGQITMRKVDGWKTLTQASAPQEAIDLAA